jgi:cell division protein FtsB
MDRYDYVEKLLKERDKLEEEIAQYRVEIFKLQKRTKEYILNWGEENTCNEEMVCFTTNSAMFSFQTAEMPENERVSDEAIKKLYQGILNLEQQKESLKNEIEELKDKDFLSFLKNLINEDGVK